MGNGSKNRDSYMCAQVSQPAVALKQTQHCRSTPPHVKEKLCQAEPATLPTGLRDPGGRHIPGAEQACVWRTLMGLTEDVQANEPPWTCTAAPLLMGPQSREPGRPTKSHRKPTSPKDLRILLGWKSFVKSPGLPSSSRLGTGLPPPPSVLSPHTYRPQHPWQSGVARPGISPWGER